MDSITLNKENTNKTACFKTFWMIILIIVSTVLFGFVGGFTASYYFNDYFGDYPRGIGLSNNQTDQDYLPQTLQEEKVITAVKSSSPAVVSIIISKDLPILEEYFVDPFENFFGPSPFQIPQYRQKGTEKQEIGGGTGFIISTDGTVVTQKQFPTIKLGDSSKLQIGQTVIAIGNALGEFKNTVSTGVVSGLGRTVTASGGEEEEILEDIIQTDAAINRGNSGGPLLNLGGEVVGINTAMALGADNIGFAIPINKVKKAIEQVQSFGKIVYPFLGVNYVLVNDKTQKDNNLEVNYGVWVLSPSSGSPAIMSGSAAEKAGIKEGDIILEFGGKKITTDNSLAKIILDYNPGDEVELKILRNGEEKIIEATLGERSE
ncbi:MAG: 2-alkenal reductase [Parcubacteria group bacterium GW2011_GWC1_38_6]|nr:MAG: 2-alkenal reductase [Parcubacteria group bacterium GW2011_GWC1_38_6]